MVDAAPLEILARGPLAVQAYQKALSEGKTSVKRVPIMFIGQGQSGKTSLKRSLKGERFNPEETSTEGIEMDPSYCNVSKELWKVGGKTQSTNADPAPISYEQRTAQFILTSLKEGGKEPKSNKMKNDAVLMHDETPSFTEDESSRETGSLTREATPEIPAAELPEFQEVLEVPEEIAALIKKLLQVVDNGNDEEDMYATLWDFGGQSVYYATHPLFLTTRAIYFLVYNLSRNPNEQVSPQVKCGFYKNVEDVFCERSNMDYLDIWMSSVSNLVSQDEDPQEMSASETLPERLPPVFLVCTHADKFQNSNPNELAREIFGSLKTRSYGKHLVDVFVVDNTKSGRGEECPGVTSLRNEVQTLVNELPQMKEAIPIKWLKYEKAVKVMLEDGYKWIPLEQARQIALEVCGISSAEQFLALLNFLHDQRILIHFDDTPQLNKMVILDPQWLIDVFKKVITIRPYHSKERKYEKLWLKLETTGMLEEKLLQHVWGPLFDNRETCDSLIAMMEKFCLLCPWSSSTESESPNEYLVPSMLMFPPQEDITKLIASARIPSLFLKFKSTQVPSGLFPRLVLMVFQWCIKELSSQSQPQLHQNFARFYTHPVEGCSIILICHSSFIEVVVHKERSVVGLSTDVASGINLLSESKYDAFQVDFARAVCRQLGLILECMRKEFPWLKNIAYDFLVCCPVCCTRRSLNHCRSHNVRGCKEEQCLHLLSESQLRACLGPIVCTRAVSAVNCRVPVNCVGFWFRSLDEQVKY